MEDPRETVCGGINDEAKKKLKLDAEREQNRWHEVYNWYTIYKSLKDYGDFLPRTLIDSSHVTPNSMNDFKYVNNFFFIDFKACHVTCQTSELCIIREIGFF